MAWQLLAAALPAAAKVAGTYLQKPSREDYKPQTDYMKKYLSYLRGRSANKEVLHMAMQPQLRAIGRQGREMQRQVGYDVAKSGLTGTGIEAQMRLSAGAKTQEALSEATGKAVAAQAAEDARIGERSADLAARIGAEEQRAEQAYETAGRQWKRQMGAEALGLGASIAGAGIGQKIQADKAVSYAMSPTVGGMFGGEEKVRQMVKEGWTQEMFASEANRMTSVINTYGKDYKFGDLKRGAEIYSGTQIGAQADVTAEEDVSDAVEPIVDEAIKPVSEKEPLGKRIFGKYYDREAQNIAPRVRKSFLEGKYYDREAQDIAGKVRKSMGKDEKPVEEVVEPVEEVKVEPETKVEEPVVEPKEVKTEEPKVQEEPKPEPEPEPEATVKEVYKNKPYDIYDKKKTKSKTFRYTGNKTAGGKYEFKSDDGRRLTLTLEELNDRLKKKGEKDVVGIRKKLVEGGHEIVDVTAKTGISSVLAEGKAKIRMAEPLANKFLEAQKILADKGIEIQVADSLVDYGVKKKQYEEYLAGGEKGAKVADPDRSFHTIGFAFDLAQSPEMKRPEVAEVLKSVGLVPHDTEWWHWSLEKV